MPTKSENTSTLAYLNSVLTVVLHKLGFLVVYTDNTTTKFLSSLCKAGQLSYQQNKNKWKKKNLHSELYDCLKNSQYFDQAQRYLT